MDTAQTDPFRMSNTTRKTAATGGRCDCDSMLLVNCSGPFSDSVLMSLFRSVQRSLSLMLLSHHMKRLRGTEVREARFTYSSIDVTVKCLRHELSA